MRVTKKTKLKTRAAILSAARNLFVEKGFEKTITRDITTKAGIAAGTLFNYFPSKEALGLEIICEELEEAKQDYTQLLRGEEALDEALFLYIITGLNRLKPHRHYVAEIVETALSPFAGSETGERIRLEHLQMVADLTKSHHIPNPLSFVTVQLYWTLYLGVLSFWAQDSSENQEDTLVLLDESLRLFVASLPKP